jgi:hypothetical protein
MSSIKTFRRWRCSSLDSDTSWINSLLRSLRVIRQRKRRTRWEIGILFFYEWDGLLRESAPTSWVGVGPAGSVPILTDGTWSKFLPWFPFHRLLLPPDLKSYINKRIKSKNMKYKIFKDAADLCFEGRAAPVWMHVHTKRPTHLHYSTRFFDGCSRRCLIHRIACICIHFLCGCARRIACTCIFGNCRRSTRLSLVLASHEFVLADT